MACGKCPGGGGNPPVSSCGANCFRVKNITIPCSEDTSPCGSSFSKNLATDNTTLNGCSNGDGACDVTFQLLSHTSDVENVVITEAGLLTGDTTDSAVPNAMAVIRYKIFCNCNSLSGRGKVYVCINDLCKNTEPCETGFECNKCNGLCEESIGVGVG